MGAETTTAERHVFAFEGRGGFPTWASRGENTQPRRLTDSQGRPIPERGRLSPSQVLNYWYDVVRAAGATGWRYYAQNHWRRALADLRTLLQPPEDGPAEPGRCGAIALLGFSNGGDAVYQVARALQGDGRKVDLVVTVDPVRKPLHGIGLLGFRRPANVDLWHNFYQRCDRRTLAGLLPVVGRSVDGADTNRRFSARDFPSPMNPAFAHLWLPAHPAVTQTITRCVMQLGGRGLGTRPSDETAG